MGAKRHPVDYNYTALNWTFIKGLAKIAQYAAGKYGSAEQYLDSRLEEEKSPINHAIEHLVLYMQGVPHDHFGTVDGQLWAAGYNIMMEIGYFQKYGWIPQKLAAKIAEKLEPVLKKPHIHAGFKDPMDDICDHWGYGSKQWDPGKAKRLYCSKCKGIVEPDPRLGSELSPVWFVVERDPP